MSARRMEHDLYPIEQARHPPGAHACQMNSHRTTPAEDSVATLQRSVRSGSPVLIPGALERRVGRPTAALPGAAVESIAPRVAAAAVGDRARLEIEREGGGAANERAGARPKTILANFLHRVFNAVLR
jgi:hypothetical protein